MEKSKPHHLLPTVKTLVAKGRVQINRVALQGAAELGMGVQDILAVVSSLKNANFYKSMTAYADHTSWQDVYHPETESGALYLKLTVCDDVLIISFKEK